MTGIAHWAPLTHPDEPLCGASPDPTRDEYAVVCDTCEERAKLRTLEALARRALNAALGRAA